MSAALVQFPQWKQTTANGDWVYAAAHVKDGVVIQTMDDTYARFTPEEARAHAQSLTEAASYIEKRTR